MRRSFLLVALLVGCNPDAGLKVNNSLPTASITAPSDGTALLEGTALEMAGTVGDPNDATASLSAAWWVDGAELCAAAAPAADGSTTCSAVLAPGPHTLVLDVRDPAGASAQDTVEVDILEGDTPLVQLLSPDGSGRHYAGTPIAFSATVADTEDAADALVLAWSSSLEGALALPAAANSDGTVGGNLALGEGTHELTLSATDSADHTGSDSVSVTVGPANRAPDCGVTSPESPAIAEEGATVSFAGTATDADEAASALAVTWTSDKDGPLGTSTADSDGSLSFATAALSVDTHTVTLRVEDELGEVCTDSVVVTVGNRPDVQIDSPLGGTVVNAGTSLTFAATVSDAEDPAIDLELAWVSDVDGGLDTTAADSAGLATFQTAALSAGTHIVTLDATDTAGFVGRDTVSFTVNGLPNAPGIELRPDPALTTDDLSVAIVTDATDPEGSSLAYQYVWSKDGVVQSALTSATVGASNTARGETWSVAVSADDGTGVGPAATASVVVGNTPPAVTGITMTPSPLTTDDVLTPVIASTDADGDPLSFAFAWAVNGVALTATGSTLDGATHFDRGDTVTVTVTPSDGTDTGSPVSASVTVANSAPAVASVTLSPSTVYTDDVVAALAGATSDADGDPVTLSYAWTVDGVSTGTTATTLDGSTHFDKGEVVRVVVTPSDGTDTGATVAASATVANSAPSAPAIALDPLGPEEGLDDLICELSTAAVDPDGDPITYTFEWEVDGTAYPDGDTGSGWLGPFTTTLTDDSVPGADLFEGEQWTCGVTASDGTDTSARVEATTTVASSSTCGNGTLDSTEEIDPAPGPFSTVSADLGTCRWDFSGVEQLYCNGSCTWAGGSGCDQADADILCKLVTDNPAATAISWTATTALSTGGFPCTPLGYGTTINVNNRGVSVPVSWQDASILGNHGPGAVVAYPICNDP